LVELIRRTADGLTTTEVDYRTAGLRNAAIVNAMLDDAVKLARHEHREMMAVLLSRFVPSVLGERPDGEIVKPLIPGLELPDWFAVPSPESVRSGPGWKKDRDCTPVELQRIVDHRREVIVGHSVEMNKFILLRATALERGCDEEQPISTVFPDAPPPIRPDDRPTV
jgi:hypothetical protein